MGYTVISQNNTTTTLQDENGNIVHVPAKTVLATSTEYEISEVNNSTATLTSSDGKVIRGIPCVAVLSSSEGGGGGAVSSVNGQTGDVVITGNDVLPDQTGQSGKFLTTDGTDASWSDKPLVNNATGNYSLVVGSGSASGSSTVSVGSATSSGNGGIFIGSLTQGTNVQDEIAIGWYAAGGAQNGITIGGYNTSGTVPLGTISIGRYANPGPIRTENEKGTFWVTLWESAFSSGTYKLMSSDGTIPADRLVHAINKYSTMPTAASTNEGWIVQFTGTTDSTYTHGHLYECVSDGQTPATYSWTEVQLGSGSSLPSQTGNAGKFLTTDGTDASWSDKPLVNTATPTNSLSILGTNTTSDNTITIGKNCNVYGTQGNSVVIGNSISVNYVPESVGIGNNCVPYNYSVCVGKNSGGAGSYAVSLGWQTRVNATHAIQIGNTGSTTTNSDANTMKVANANGNFEMMSADGTIPAARHAALPAADGTYTLQLVITDGVPTLSWVAV